MCGIAGFVGSEFSIEARNQIVRAMTATLTPRGPDGEGYHLDDWASLGHRRLSIIDIEGGAQPMSTEDGRYWIVYNGEIYNYIEIRRELEIKGVRFRTSSDTEVLLQVLVRDGAAGLQKCNGMFAFAFYDSERQTLLLARDRMGIKPLYYAAVRNGLVFASELKAILKYPGVDRAIAPLAVSKFLTFGYIPAPHTIFGAVNKLEPGFFALYRDGKIEKRMYWDIPMTDNPVSRANVDQSAQQLIELLSDSIVKRFRSDVPVGIFLSGGVDSSTITALAARKVGAGLHTFSIGFEEQSYDESPYAARVAALCGTEHHHEVLSQARARQMLPEAMKILDEPFADASILPTFLLCRFAAQHVKVCLGGDGGDELFAGYPSFQAHRIMDRLSVLPVSWRDALNRMARRLPVSHSYASLEFLLQQFFKGAGVSAEIRFFLWMGYYGQDQKRALLAPDVQSALLRANPFEDVLNYVTQSRLVSDFERILYLCSKLYLQDDILVKVDRASMANSLEVRVPFLDHDVVEFAAGIRSDYKLHGLTTKYLLKKAVRDLLPRDIIHRRKAGFMIPLAVWMERDLRSWVEDICNREDIERDGFFDYGCVRRLMDEHFRAERDNRKLIWPIVCFQLWRRNYA